MFGHRIYVIALLAILPMIILSATQGNYVNAEKRECGDLKWGDKAHDDNSPSTKEFKKSAYTDNLCELAKKVDHEQVSNHDSVDWKKFKSSPAYITATSEQKECLNKAHKEGNGMDGLGGYEILYCGIDND